MQQPGSGAGDANNIRDMLEMAIQQQQTRAGPLVTIGEPTLVAGGGARSGSGSASGLATSTGSEPTYTYKVKIVSVHYLNNCSTSLNPLMLYV